jgi:hypothetical protein
MMQRLCEDEFSTEAGASVFHLLESSGGIETLQFKFCNWNNESFGPIAAGLKTFLSLTMVMCSQVLLVLGLSS